MSWIILLQVTRSRRSARRGTTTLAVVGSADLCSNNTWAGSDNEHHDHGCGGRRITGIHTLGDDGSASHSGTRFTATVSASSTTRRLSRNTGICG